MYIAIKQTGNKTMRDIIAKLEAKLNANSDAKSVRHFNKDGKLINEIPLNDSRAMYQSFYKNGISGISYEFDVTELGEFCVQAFTLRDKDKDRELLSWCLCKLLEEAHMIRFKHKEMDININGILRNPKVILLLWFLHKVFNFKDGQPSDCIFKWELGKVNQDRFHFFGDKKKFSHLQIMRETFAKFLPYASKIDTCMLANRMDFYSAYEKVTSISNHDAQIRPENNLIFPKKFEDTWQSCENEPIHTLCLLLQDYVQLPWASASPHTDRFLRFFTGRWNQHHVPIVRELLKLNSVETIFMLPSDFKCLEYLLEGLRHRLILDRQTVNPVGTLASIITFIQNKANCQVINIEELNQAISNNKNHNLLRPIQPNEHEQYVESAVNEVRGILRL